MLHDTGKSIAVSFGFVPEKLQVETECSRKVGLTFFFFFFLNEVGDLCMCCCVCCLLVWMM